MNKYQLAAAVLALWENDVRRFAPDEHMRWQTLLDRLPDDLSPDAMRDAFGPLAAKSDKEQALFESLFKRALMEVEAVAAPDLPKVIPNEPLDDPDFFEKYGYWLLGAFLGILLVCGWYVFVVRNPSPRFERIKIYISTTPNVQRENCPDSLELKKISIVRKAVFFSGNESMETKYGTYTILPAGCIRFNPSGLVGNDSVHFTIRYREEGMIGDGAPSTYHYAIPVDVFVAVDSAKQVDSILTSVTDTVFFAHDAPFNHDTLLQKLAFNPSGTDYFLHRWALWVKAGLWLLLALLLYNWMRWRAMKRRKLVAQRDKSARPPYVWNIRLKNLLPPDPGETLGQTLNALRRRTDDETRLIDVPATVRATIRKGGMASIRFKQQTRPPEYLMLVDRQNSHDHRARLYEDLYRILRQNDVLTECFFFEGDLRLCHNDQYPEGLSIDELLFRFAGHRLLIVSTGRQLFSPTTGKLAKWTEQFTRWKDRALLSTLPAVDWGRRERSLAEIFRFAPASLPGIRRLLEAFETAEEERGPAFDKLAPLAIGDPVLLEGGDLLHTLEKHFPDPITRTWLAACALWPELHYDLTLWLGRWLGQDSGQAVATMARMGDILRLPWFATGEMPDFARATLIDWMRESNPTLEIRLRTALHGMLEENGPDPESVAWDEFAMRLAFNEWMFNTDPATKKALEEKIARWLETHEPDFIVVRELNGKPGPLDSILPDSWKKSLFKGKLSGLGLRDRWRDLLGVTMPVLALAALGLWYWTPQEPVCTGDQAQIVMGGDTLTICQDSEEKKLLVWEYGMRGAAERADSIRFDSLYKVFPMHLDSAAKSSLSRECLANVSNAAFNAGILYYSFINPLQRRSSPEAVSSLKSATCYWFGRAMASPTSDSLQRWVWANGVLYSPTLPWVRKGAAWCNPGWGDATASEAQTSVASICRRVANVEKGLGFRLRSLSSREYKLLLDNLDPVLDKKTLIRILPSGTQVTLLDSTATSWKVEFQGQTGYVAKMYRSRPTLLPCGVLLGSQINLNNTGRLAGFRLATGSMDNSARIWQLDDPKQYSVFQGHSDWVASVDISADGRLLATGSSDNTAKTWDIGTGKVVFTFRGHKGHVTSVAFSPDGSKLATGSDDQTLIIWDVRSGKQLLRLTGHTSDITEVAFSPDGRLIASASLDNTAKIWDLATGRLRLDLAGHTSWVESVAFSPDGTQIATGSDDKTVKIWDLNSGSEVMTLSGHTNFVMSVAFSPDGQKLVSGSGDKTAMIWDLSLGKKLLTLKGHTASVQSVRFSPDGQSIATGSNDKSARIWNAKTGANVTTLLGHKGAVLSVCYTNGLTIPAKDFLRLKTNK